MTAISPTLIAARYPLCLEDDTLMNDDELIRYVRARCGGDVADVITDLIYATSVRAKVADIACDIATEVSSVSNHLDELKEYLEEIRELVKEE